jgi:hypothetical protein
LEKPATGQVNGERGEIGGKHPLDGSYDLGRVRRSVDHHEYRTSAGPPVVHSPAIDDNEMIADDWQVPGHGSGLPLSYACGDRQSEAVFRIAAIDNHHRTGDVGGSIRCQQ